MSFQALTATAYSKSNINPGNVGSPINYLRAKAFSRAGMPVGTIVPFASIQPMFAKAFAMSSTHGKMPKAYMFATTGFSRGASSLYTTFTPTVGASVLYFNKNLLNVGENSTGPYAAIVLSVNSRTYKADLLVLRHNNMHYAINVPQNGGQGTGAEYWQLVRL